MYVIVLYNSDGYPIGYDDVVHASIASARVSAKRLDARGIIVRIHRVMDTVIS